MQKWLFNSCNSDIKLGVIKNNVLDIIVHGLRTLTIIFHQPLTALFSVSRESGDDPEVAQEEVRHIRDARQQTQGPVHEVRYQHQLKPCDKPAESVSCLRACNAEIEQQLEAVKMTHMN